jgi:flavin-dependent dehydrogenase
MGTASAKGTDRVREKVVDLERRGDYWDITTTSGQHSAKIVVGTDGQNSLVRKKTIGQADREDNGFTVGHLLSALEKDEFTIAFMHHGRGYIWVIPRAGQTNAGICCTEVQLAKGLKGDLDAFLRANHPDPWILSTWALLISIVKKQLLQQAAGRQKLDYNRRCCRSRGLDNGGGHTVRPSGQRPGSQRDHPE